MQNPQPSSYVKLSIDKKAAASDSSDCLPKQERGVHGDHEDAENYEEGEETHEGGQTTQILPTKYVKSIERLVQVLKDMVGERGTFQIEMQHTFYIIKSPIKIEMPGTANQFGDGHRMFANFGGSQNNIEGSNYESGGGVMNI
ncbi:hypothetical protein V8F06_014125, partial [Rhypophila decipiens]